VTVDEGDLVWVAAVASGMESGAVLDGCDVAGLARVVARCELAGNPIDEAAAALVGIAREQPFPRANAAAAWLAAAHLLAGASLGVRAGEDELVSLVSAARSGSVGEAAAGAALAGWVEWREPRGGPVRRALRWLVAPAVPAVPGAGDDHIGRVCPACGRALRAEERDARGIRMAWVGTDRFELTARCWYEHRAHGRDGRPLPEPPASPPSRDTRWCPVASADSAQPPGSFCAFVPAGGLLFLAEPAGPGAGGYRVVAVPGAEVSDLLGSWPRLSRRGRELARAPAAAVRFDAGGLALDLAHLAAAVPALDLRHLDAEPCLVA
jgi:hypothetical protein